MTEQIESALINYYTVGKRQIARPQVAKALLDQVVGPHHLPDSMKPEDKRTFVIGLTELIHTIESIGWMEHTNDWDIEYSIRTLDGYVNGLRLDEDGPSTFPEDANLDFSQIYSLTVNHVKRDKPTSIPETRTPWLRIAEEQIATHVTIEGMNFYTKESGIEDSDFSRQIHISEIDRIYITY